MRAGVLGLLLLFAAALAWPQGVVIPDLRNPALYREPPRSSACRVCGEIQSIRETRAGSVATASSDPVRSGFNEQKDWAVVGAAIYVPMGSSSKDTPYVGGVGTAEMAERFGTNTYEITIRMDSGERQVVQRRDGARFRVGDRVTLSEGMLAPL